jgi:hypothetical protein
VHLKLSNSVPKGLFGKAHANEAKNAANAVQPANRQSVSGARYAARSKGHRRLIMLSWTFRCKLSSQTRSAPTGPLLAAVQQIAEWLKKLAMSEYAERFVENKIDISVLPDLTEQHLKDLGIALGIG